MQGNLKEIDVTSIIRLIEFGQRTGELLIQSPQGLSWFIFFVNGEIIYATSPEAGTSRLQDYLHALDLKEAIAQIASSTVNINVIEYGQVCTLLATKVLTPAQVTKIIHGMVTEVLFDLLSLHAGTFAFDTAVALSPQISSLKFQLVASEIFKQIQAWKQLYPRIQSLEQCPRHVHALESTPNLLSPWIDGKTSIRQLSRYVAQNPFQVALSVNTGLVNGDLVLGLPPTPKAIATKLLGKGRITCIDDSITICKAVEYILHSNGYQVTSISNPVRALSLVFQLKPNLIFCDITMPELDGYELCAMFRKSIAFSQIPIIMLTGKDGFIDRIKARMVGATEYLTKPFGERELLTIVEKYLGNSNPSKPLQDK
jgi:twitching motility two-component system response regulator PilG